MLRLLADENFNRVMLDGVLRERPDVDFVRVQDVNLSGASDSEILEWAAIHGRVVVTHDVKTMTRIANERMEAGLSMAGLFEVPDHLPIRVAIDDLLLLAVCSDDDEWLGQIHYLPLR